MEKEPKAAITTDDGTPSDYEAPRVETVLGTTDLEREVMHGIISQIP